MFRALNDLRTISIKEIIPPITKYEIDVWVKKDGVTIREYHRETFVKKVVASWIRVLDRMFRFKK